jgi:hypothetical protein
MHPTIGYEMGPATAADLRHQVQCEVRVRAGRSDGGPRSGGAPGHSWRDSRWPAGGGRQATAPQPGRCRLVGTHARRFGCGYIT